MKQALIFAAGLGTRLRPLTDNLPKALAPVGGYPMLQHVIQRLTRAGYTHIVVNACHFADKIVAFVDSLDSPAKIDVVVEEGEPLETGGGLLNAQPYFDPSSPITLHNADILTDFDLQPMAQQHSQTSALATLLAFDRHTTRYFLFSPDDDRLQGWLNTTTMQVRPDGLDADGLERRAFGGVHMVSPDIFGLLRQYARRIGKTKFSITDFYIDYAASQTIMGYQPAQPFRWHDVGTIEKLRQAEDDFKAI